MKKQERHKGTKFVGTHLTEEEHAKMRALAGDAMRSLSQELRLAIRKHAGLEKAS